MKVRHLVSFTHVYYLTVDYDVYFVLTMYNTISFVSFKIKFQNVELLTFIVLCTVASSFYTLQYTTASYLIGFKKSDTDQLILACANI